MPNQDLLSPGGSQQGPFSSYLNPTQTPPDATPPATGWEAHPHAVMGADLALGFLKGIRQQRIRSAADQEQNNQTALDSYRTQVAQLAQDPNLTDEGRQAILKQANDTMAAHTQYELRDAPKEGIGGFFKNLLVHATGGPIKSRDPINFHEESGKLTSLAQQPGYSQKANFESAVGEAQQAVGMLKQTNPYPTQQEVQQAVSGAFQKVSTGAPKYLEAFMQSVGVPMGPSYPGAGSAEALFRDLQRTAPGTQTPPAPVAAGGEPGGRLTGPPPAGEFGEPMSRFQQYATEPPPTPVAGSPAQPSAGALSEDLYVPGYDSRRLSAIENYAGARDSRATVPPSREAVINSGPHKGQRLLVREVSGVSPTDNGLWDATTGRKLDPNTSVSYASLAANTKVNKDEEGYAIVSNDGGQTWGRSTMEGKPFKVSQGWAIETDPFGNQVWVNKGELKSGESHAGAMYVEGKKDAREDKSLKAADERQDKAIGNANTHQDTAIDAARTKQRVDINLSFDRRVDGVKRSAAGRLSANQIPGYQPSQKDIDAAARPDIDAIEKERKAALKDFDTGRPVRTATPPAGAAPPTSAPPAKVVPPKATPTPAAPAVVKGSALLGGN